MIGRNVCAVDIENLHGIGPTEFAYLGNAAEQPRGIHFRREAVLARTGSDRTARRYHKNFFHIRLVLPRLKIFML